MIEVKNLVKKYGDNVAVNGISFKLEPGRIYGFLGPNGAGKSTTMNIMTGYIGATSGDVIINGHNILEEPIEAKKCIGYLPEIPPVYPDMTVNEYLHFAAKIKQIPKKDIEENVVKARRLARIDNVQNKLIGNLSKGYKQRVGVAYAILGFPEIIILDEPTVGLDPKQIIEIRETIRELAHEHTVILSSHILTEISEVCDYVLIINHGEIVISDTMDNISKFMADTGKIEIRFEDDPAALEKAIDGIANAKVLDYKKSGNTGIAVIGYDDTDEGAESIFYALAANKLKVTGFSKISKTLEDVFIELTDSADEIDKAAKEIKEVEE